jgi:hypothetical protein
VRWWVGWGARRASGEGEDDCGAGRAPHKPHRRLQAVAHHHRAPRETLRPSPPAIISAAMNIGEHGESLREGRRKGGMEGWRDGEMEGGRMPKHKGHSKNCGATGAHSPAAREFRERSRRRRGEGVSASVRVQAHPFRVGLADSNQHVPTPHEPARRRGPARNHPLDHHHPNRRQHGRLPGFHRRPRPVPQY